MNDLYLRACRGEAVERTPVWMMRQAGRYLPEYRAVRSQTDFLTLCKTPDLAAEVTLQPVDLVGVDAAIIFADILLPLEAMGAELKFVQGDGPVLPQPVRRREDMARLSRPDVEATLGYVFDALRVTRGELAKREGDRRVPLIGFAGTPWTLAAYLVEGGTSKQFTHLLGWSYRDPDVLRDLLDRIADVTIDYLLGQVAAGAQSLQHFDTWGGLLSARRWRELAAPSLTRVIEGVRAGAPDVPQTYYAQGTHLLEESAKLPVDVLSVDWRQPLSAVREVVGADRVLQGNLDPATLLGTVEAIERATAAMLADAAGGPHVANLGHGIFKQTDPEHAKAFIQAVKRGAVR
ncbi:MAG TPA: uroporphyrinogen decarboxylase [Thermoanaerobaculia bacterium]|nr:uroporphyrinogen decarboxylase [Thermoanaerobaculia bacterium]